MSDKKRKPAHKVVVNKIVKYARIISDPKFKEKKVTPFLLLGGLDAMLEILDEMEIPDGEVAWVIEQLDAVKYDRNQDISKAVESLRARQN